MLESVLRVFTNNCCIFAVAIVDVDEQLVLVNALVVLRSCTCCEDAFEAAIAAR